MSLVIGGLFSFRQQITRHKRPLLAGNTAGDAWERGRQSVMQSHPAMKIISLFLSSVFRLIKKTLSDSITFLNSFFQTNNKPIFTTKMSTKNCVTGNVFSCRSRDLLYKQFPKNNQKSASRVTILKKRSRD